MAQRDSERTPAEGWTYEVCRNGFKIKIGLEQHKKLAHPVVRNIERMDHCLPPQIKICTRGTLAMLD